MKYIILIIFVFCTIKLSSQTITPKQDAEIFYLSKKSAKIISDNIFTIFMIKKSDNYNINIIVPPATNAMNKTTTFGIFYSKHIVSAIHTKLNAGIIKKYHYNIYSDKSEIKDASLVNYTLKMSYLFTNNSLIVSQINMSTDNQIISLKSYEITGNITEINELDKVAENINFNNIFDINANNNLFDSVIIYDSKKHIIPIKMNKCNLQINTDYKFRFYLKSHTFLYVFYYEPQKSNFNLIYPLASSNNKKLTYYIKDIRGISFKNVNNAKIKIVVSNEILKINDVIDNNNNISADQAEIIYKEIHKNIDNISTFNLDIKF